MNENIFESKVHFYVHSRTATYKKEKSIISQTVDNRIIGYLMWKTKALLEDEPAWQALDTQMHTALALSILDERFGVCQQT